MATSTTELSILVKLRDEATARMQQISGALANAKEASEGFAKGLLGGGAVLAGLGGLALKSASDAEQSAVAFTTMLGSAEKAHAFVANMKEFAAKTPFETSDISKAAQTMLAFGINTESVMPYVQMIGDVAMGNKEKFSSLSLVFAQVQATGKLMRQDLLQMINQGFNPLLIISEKTGKSISELKDEMEKGAISADMVTEAFRIATSEGGRFYGGMEAQSKTLAGVWSTLQDTFNEFLRVQGEELLPIAKEFVAILSDFVQNVLPQWISRLKDIIEWFKQNKAAIYMVSGAIVGGLIPSVVGATKAFAMALGALSPFLAAGALLGLLIGTTFPFWISITQDIINWLKEHQSVIYILAGAIIGGLIPAIGTLIPTFMSLGITMMTVTIPAFIAATAALAPWLIGGVVIGGVIAGIVWLIQNWTMVSQKAVEIWGGISDYLIGVSGVIVSSVSNAFNTLSGTMNVVWNTIGEVFRSGTSLLSGIMMTFLDLLFPSWRESFQKVIDFCNVFFPIVQSVFDTSLNFLSNIWTKTWNTISSSFIGAFNTVKANLFEFSGWITGIFNKIAKPVNDAWGAIWDGIKNRMMSAWDGIKDTIRSSINWIIEKINWFVSQANMVASKGAGTLGISIPQLANIPMLAKGGIVTRPTIAMIGEAGPEAVIPLNRANNPGYGGITININGGNFFGSDEDVGEYIGDLMLKKLKMNVAL
ncbi:MAG: hypothetical protein MNSN_01510 [Minisyncoccus archaeiphilus]|uniref:tape measure protein n=1 Tax=Minisyncoccus archaeiphilus TaxID=3238481 RepID=UPI002B166633|nr:MAG: hypothetical protein MNSN_01510 [Candidatus Parcubacteria bacterium]